MSQTSKERLMFWGVVAVNLLMLILRRPGSFAHPQFWAEDSVVFYRDQLVLGGAATLWHLHAGYLVLIARCIALIAAGLPAGLAPRAFYMAAVSLAALSCSVLVLPWYRHLIESDWLRAVLSVLFAAGFFADELVGNVTNVQWYLALPGVLLLARRAQDDEASSTGQMLALSLAAFVLAISSPVLLILFPVCLGILLKTCLEKSGMISCGMLLGTFIQIMVILSGPSGAGEKASAVGGGLIGQVIVCTVYRAILPVIAGQIHTQYLESHFHSATMVIVLAGTARWVEWLWRSEKGHRLRLLAALYVGIASVAIATAVRGSAGLFGSFDAIHTWRGERYFYLAGCIFAYLAARSMAIAWPGRHGAALIFAAIFAWAAIADFRVPQFTDFWSKDAGKVEAWRQARQRGVTYSIAVPVNPVGWELVLPGTMPSNADFEAATISPWVVFGSPVASVSTAEHYEGRQSLGLSKTGGVFQDISGLREGSIYRVTAKARAMCGSTPQGLLWLHDTNGQDGVRDGPRPVSCDGWQEFAANFKADANGLLRIHLHAVAEDGTVFWDDVRLTKLP